MYKRLTKPEMRELRERVDAVVNTWSKAEAALPARQLEYAAARLKPHLDPYFSGKLSEVVSYAKAASGRVKEKEHWTSVTEQCWYVFENGVLERSAD